MSGRTVPQVVTATSPSSATTTIASAHFFSLARCDFFTIDADLTEATGGTLDVYLQRKVDANTWRDWLHFPQLAAGSAVHHYSVSSGYDQEILIVGTGTDSAATPALAADTFVGGHPGTDVRVVFVAGSGTSAGASQTIRITGWDAG